MQDIKLIHELNEDLNQRIILIKQDVFFPLDIITSQDKNISYYHATYMKRYLDFAYLKDETLQKLNLK